MMKEEFFYTLNYNNMLTLGQLWPNVEMLFGSKVHTIHRTSLDQWSECSVCLGSGSERFNLLLDQVPHLPAPTLSFQSSVARDSPRKIRACIHKDSLLLRINLILRIFVRKIPTIRIFLFIKIPILRIIITLRIFLRMVSIQYNV